MPDRPQSIAPSPWNESAAFRETTLRLFTKPEDRAALVHLGAMLHDMAIETAPYGPDPESATHGEMRAAAADLRHLEGFLATVRRSADESALVPADEALARFAGEQAAAVGMLAELIEGEL
jgi:hypothetical protein